MIAFLKSWLARRREASRRHDFWCGVYYVTEELRLDPACRPRLEAEASNAIGRTAFDEGMTSALFFDRVGGPR